jgi:hypothetical protein
MEKGMTITITSEISSNYYGTWNYSLIKEVYIDKGKLRSKLSRIEIELVEVEYMYAQVYNAIFESEKI